MAGLAGETANLIVALKLDDSGFSGRLNAAARSLRGFDGPLSRMGRGTGQLAGGLSRLATVGAAAAAGGLAAVVTTAASFEQAFTGVEKTVDGTDAELAELEQTLRAMARSIPVSFEELSAIGEAGGALGIARESLDEFVDVVARLAVSTDLSSEQAATSLGQLANVLKLGEGDLEDFADSLVALGNAGASTESQIVEMAARFGAAGNSAGLSKEEILALSSAVASMGIEVEAGGSSLSRIFGNITTIIGTGSDKIVAFTDTLGISAREFRESWEEDALGTFQDFLAALNELDQFEQASVLEKAGITGVRDINAVRLMAQNFGFLNEQLEIAKNATGALDTESQKFFDTTIGQWGILKNNIRDAAATIGAELLPITNELIGDFVDRLQDPAVQSGIKQFATDLAGGIRGLMEELKGTDFSGIIGGLKIAAQVAKGAFDAFRALPQPIQQLAIAALVANKVSGGAIGQIAKGLGNITLGGAGLGAKLFGMRGATPANPMFVKEVGLGGIGGKGGLPIGGVGGAAAGGGALAGALALGGGILLPFAMFNVIPELFKGRPGAGSHTVRRTNAEGKTIVSLDQQTTAMFQGMIPSFTATVERTGGEVTTAIAMADDSIDRTRDELRDLHNPLDALRTISTRSALGIETVRAETRTLQGITQAAGREQANAAATVAQRIAEQRQTLMEQKLALNTIAAKDPSVTVDANVTVNTFVSGTMIARQQSITRVASGFRGGIPIGPG